MNNTVLQLLQIFENETDSEHREFNVTAEKGQKRFDWATLVTGVVSGAAITTFAVVAWKAISSAISKK